MTSIQAEPRKLHAATGPSSIDRILIATAGDPDSKGALRIATALSQRDGLQVMALGVSMPFPHTLSSLIAMNTPMVVDEESRRDMLRRITRRIDVLPGGNRWTKRAMVGIPADVINDVAATWGASLIIIGIGRHGRLDRLFGTETAIAVMRRSTVPVLAVNPHARHLPKRALAALDFTPASRSAAELAAALLAPDGGLVVTHVASFAGIKPRDGDLVDLYRTGAQTKLDDTVRLVRRHTTRPVEGLMLEGEPADALLRYARREHCDLVALGGHSQGLMDRILLGSVRTRIVRGANCSVLIAPPAEPRD